MNAITNYIDVHQQIKESNSQFLKRLPRFTIDLIKIIIKQDEINRILFAYADYEGVDFLPKVVSELNIKVDIEGLHNLPDNGRCFFVANHPFGFADGLILTNTIAQKYGDFRAIGNEVFTLIPHLRPIVAAVNVFGTNPRKYLLELEKVFASHLPITHFPAGLVSRAKGCRIEDRDWQKSFVTKAIEHRRDVVPVFFYGRNSRLFYVIYIGRKILGIKANLELVLLPREIFNKRNKPIRVRIGKPISYDTFNNNKTHFEWAQYVKQQVNNLKN
ncbi:MAG: glycerol acyltransferase [Bacteroidetes bacterium]|nr:glycerol acyltransferase [Bacteroidota bacterium]